MTRQQQKHELLIMLGKLLAPLDDVVERPEGYDRASRSRAAGKFANDSAPYTRAVREFGREPGVVYQAEVTSVTVALRVLGNCLREEAVLDDSKRLRTEVARTKAIVEGALGRIPVDEPSEVLEAHSPFAAYCRIRELCEGARHEIVMVDRYMSGCEFHRFLQQVSPGVQVTVLTWPSPPRQPKEWEPFRDVSKLYALERGPDPYRLVVHPGFHARWLQCDEAYYMPDASFKDAGWKAATALARLPEDPGIAKLIAEGTELFGPNHPQHP
jgi:hypothetical protein